MFKKSILAVSLIGLGLIAAPTQASEPYPYIAGSIGTAKHSIGTVDFDYYDFSFGSKNDTAYKFLIGIQANDYIAAEVQYTDLGKVSKTHREYSLAGTVLDSEKLKTDTYGIGFNVVGTLPIHDLTLFAKLGTHRMNTSYKYTDTWTGGGFVESGTYRNWTTLVGFGAAYAVTPHVELTLEYENYYDIADEYDARLLSAGVRYNF